MYCTRITLSALALVLLTGCTSTKLSNEDRALLMETRAMAEQARDNAAASAQAAQAASDNAAKSALAAQQASEKADRIFKQSNEK